MKRVLLFVRKRTALVMIFLGTVCPAHARVDCKKELQRARTVEELEKLLSVCPDIAPKIQENVDALRLNNERHKLEALALAEVKKTPNADRYTIPIVIDRRVAAFAGDPKLGGGAVTLTPTGYQMSPGDQMLVVGRQMVPPVAADSIYRFKGRVDISTLPFSTKGYQVVGEGDDLNLLTFVIQRNGLVYLRGKGKVVTPASLTVLLGNEQTPGVSSSTSESGTSTPPVRSQAVPQQGRGLPNSSADALAATRVRTLDRTFKLTEDQKASGTDIFNKAFAARQEQLAAIETETQALAGSIEQNDAVRRAQAIATLRNFNAQLVANEARADAAFYAKLTADQQVRFQGIPSLAVTTALSLTDGVAIDPLQRVRNLARPLMLSEDQGRNAVLVFVRGLDSAIEPRLTSDGERANLSAAIRSNDKDAIERSANKLGGLAAETIRIAAEAELAFYDLLNPEQKSKYKSGSLVAPRDMILARRKDPRLSPIVASATTENSQAELFHAPTSSVDKAVEDRESGQASTLPREQLARISQLIGNWSLSTILGRFGTYQIQVTPGTKIEPQGTDRAVFKENFQTPSGSSLPTYEALVMELRFDISQSRYLFNFTLGGRHIDNLPLELTGTQDLRGAGDMQLANNKKVPVEVEIQIREDGSKWQVLAPDKNQPAEKKKDRPLETYSFDFKKPKPKP